MSRSIRVELYYSIQRPKAPISSLVGSLAFQLPGEGTTRRSWLYRDKLQVVQLGKSPIDKSSLAEIIELGYWAY